MAYDSARSVTVLFGGWPGAGNDGDTWEWDGTNWTLRSSSGPSPRSGHAMAYDSARSVTVLFGGWPGAGYDGETWEWDGTSWTLRSSSGPSPGVSHAMAYDSVRGVTILFGGYEGPGIYNGETWEWDGTSWTLRSSSGPSPRYEHAMAYDSVRGVTVLFGGIDSGGLDYETWEGTQPWYVLTLTLKNAGSSWVHIDPYDPNWALFTYLCGTELTLTAVPVDRTFKKWKIWPLTNPNDPNYPVSDTNSVLYLTMDRGWKVKAIFKCGGGGIEGALPLLTAFGVLGLVALIRRKR